MLNQVFQYVWLNMDMSTHNRLYVGVIQSSRNIYIPAQHSSGLDS